MGGFSNSNNVHLLFFTNKETNKWILDLSINNIFLSFICFLKFKQILQICFNFNKLKLLH